MHRHLTQKKQIVNLFVVYTGRVTEYLLPESLKSCKGQKRKEMYKRWASITTGALLLPTDVYRIQSLASHKSLTFPYCPISKLHTYSN